MQELQYYACVNIYLFLSPDELSFEVPAVNASVANVSSSSYNVTLLGFLTPDITRQRIAIAYLFI